jgi:sulfide:quinone oxidoreductase
MSQDSQQDVVIAGGVTLAKTRRNKGALMPAGVNRLRDRSANFNPDDNNVALSCGDSIGDDDLVVCPGLAPDWHKIEGAEESQTRGHEWPLKHNVNFVNPTEHG